MRVSEAYGRLPLSFEANRGQSRASVKFLSRGDGYSLFLTSTEAILTRPRANQSGQRNSAPSSLRMRLIASIYRQIANEHAGANADDVDGADIPALLADRGSEAAQHAWAVLERHPDGEAITRTRNCLDRHNPPAQK